MTLLAQARALPKMPAKYHPAHLVAMGAFQSTDHSPLYVGALEARLALAIKALRCAALGVEQEAGSRINADYMRALADALEVKE